MSEASTPPPEKHKRAHHWTAGGSCTECGCLYVGFDRVDPCPGKASPQTSADREDECFTVVFRGNLRKLQGNPHHYETKFGAVLSIGTGNAFEEAPPETREMGND